MVVVLERADGIKYFEAESTLRPWEHIHIITSRALFQFTIRLPIISCTWKARLTGPTKPDQISRPKRNKVVRSVQSEVSPYQLFILQLGGLLDKRDHIFPPTRFIQKEVTLLT